MNEKVTKLIPQFVDVVYDYFGEHNLTQDESVWLLENLAQHIKEVPPEEFSQKVSEN